MRTFLRLNAMLIEAGVAVVDVVGGVTAGGLRRLASMGEGSVQANEPARGRDAEPQPRA